MKSTSVRRFFIGLSAMSMLIGLVLLGLALGTSLNTGMAAWHHTLFLPAIVVFAMGAFNLTVFLPRHHN